MVYLYFFFFFQAEDGIRDHCVTGVQTCALPISSASRPLSACQPRPPGWEWRITTPRSRSEERRVGKECRSRGSPYHYRKKKRVSAHSSIGCGHSLAVTSIEHSPT